MVIMAGSCKERRDRAAELNAGAGNQTLWDDGDLCEPLVCR